jgi:hypothetical protein
MTDFTMTITNTFSPNTVIASAKFNTNFQTDIRDKFNAAISGSTGHTHDGATGNGAPVVLQNAAPTVSRQLGYASGFMEYYDGSLAQKLLAYRTANIMGAGGSINFSTIKDSLLLPDQVPSTAQSLAIVGNTLQGYSTGVLTFLSDDYNNSGVKNLGISLSAGAITVDDMYGEGLSADNPAFATIASVNTPGLSVSFPITAAQTIASGGIKGRWGTTASVAWGSVMPLALGITWKNDDPTTARCFFARNPAMTTTPASTNNIGIDGTAPATSDQSNIVLFGSSANTGYNSCPCIIIGSVRATCDNSAGGVWTIATLDNGDGICNFYNFLERIYTMPIGQNGAASGKYFINNGGTAPTFTNSNSYVYKINRNGDCWVSFRFSNSSGGTLGSGVVNTLLAAPVSADALSSNERVKGTAYMIAISVNTVGICEIAGASNQIFFTYNLTAATSIAQMHNSDYNQASREAAGTLTFPAFS